MDFSLQTDKLSAVFQIRRMANLIDRGETKAMASLISTLIAGFLRLTLNNASGLLDSGAFLFGKDFFHRVRFCNKKSG